MKKIIPYGRQFISEEDIKEVVSTLKSDYLTQGPKIAEFESDFARYVGSKYAIALSNGTAALHLSTLALGVKKGDYVIGCDNFNDYYTPELTPVNHLVRPQINYDMEYKNG